MRLLGKDEINKIKNDEKAREISEGLKISRRVDVLRELQPKLEQDLENWKSTTISEIRKEIDALESQKKQLTFEVMELYEERKRGLKDVVIRQNELNNFSETLQKTESKLISLKNELEIREAEISLKEKQAKDELQRAENNREEAEHLHQEALEKKENSQKILIETERIKTEALQNKLEAEKNFTKREDKLEKFEKEIKGRENICEEKEKELRKERIRLADQRKTLERAMQRINGV